MRPANGSPVQAPIGLELTRAAWVISRAFDEALSGAGEATFARPRAAAVAFDGACAPASTRPRSSDSGRC